MRFNFKTIKLIILTIFLTTLFSCTHKVVDIKSPCVSKRGGPCGPKKPINDWWLKDYNHYQS